MTDSSREGCWCWEAKVVDFLPKETLNKVLKPGRALRRKLSQRIRAATRVIDALTKNPGNSSRINEEVARLSKIKKEDETKEAAQKAREEERCRARDEKEAEKNKLAQLKAEALKIKEQERKEREKEKENEKLKKAEVMKERMAAKVEKEKAKAEADRLKAEAEKAASAKLQKQRNMMMGFFKKKSPQVCKDAAEEKKELERGGVAVVKVKSPPAAEPKSRDSDAFWSEISGDGGGEKRRSSRRMQFKKMKGRGKFVSVSVMKTVVSPDDDPYNPFSSATPYVEPTMVKFWNRVKFLKFEEDERPPYQGTWSKRSGKVTGRRPFGKDTEFLNYEYDSENKDGK